MPVAFMYSFYQTLPRNNPKCNSSGYRTFVNIFLENLWYFTFLLIPFFLLKNFAVCVSRRSSVTRDFLFPENQSSREMVNKLPKLEKHPASTSSRKTFRRLVENMVAISMRSEVC